MKYSGGMAALVKNNIKDGVRLYHSDTYAIWLELNSTFFGVNNNIYVCITQSSTQNAHYRYPASTACSFSQIAWCAFGEEMVSFA